MAKAREEGVLITSSMTPETVQESKKLSAFDLLASQSTINNKPLTTNVANSSFHGLFLQQLANMTGPTQDNL